MIEEALQNPIGNDSQEKGQKNRKMNLWIKWIAFAIAIILAFVAATAYGVYRLGWDNQVTDAVQRVIPFPAAYVGGSIISLNDFNNRFEAFKRSVQLNQEFDFSDPANAEVVEQQKTAMLDRLIELQLEKKLAREHGITVSDEEVQQELGRIVSQSGFEQADLETLVQSIYGWSAKDFARLVVEPQIREQKLQVAHSEDHEENAQAWQEANEVLDKLRQGEDFTALAAQYSDDAGSKDSGGDLGWAGKGVFVKEFEDAAFNLEPGTVSGIVTTQFGYHIIEILNKTEDEQTGQPMVESRHILIATNDFYTWLEAQKEKATIWRFNVN